MKCETEAGRFEIKYALPVSMRSSVLDLIRGHVLPDEFARPLGDGRLGYHVHSLYFDTENLKDYFERLDRRPVRNRLRVRTYGHEGEGQPVFLENKRKSGKWVVKHRVHVCDAEQWCVSQDMQPWRAFVNDLGGRSAFAAHSFCSLVDDGKRLPVTVVHYEREVFVPRVDDGYRVRLTLDYGVSASIGPAPTSLYAPSQIKILPDEIMVMELKYEKRAPGWMKALCRELRLRPTPVSKFGLSIARGLRSDRAHELSCLEPRLSVAA